MGLPAIHMDTFVGRERELGGLRAAFDDAVNGNGRLVMVVGEPGIGKTALCKEFTRYVQERGGTTLIGHCYEEGSLSLPYLPFVQAMRSYVISRSEDDLRADLADSASHVARIMPEIRDKLRVKPGAPIDPEDDRYRLLNGVTTFLTNASKSRPLSIVLEDLHDADSGSLEMLTYLSGFLSETNALVVGTYRNVEVDRSHPLSGALAELRRIANFDRVPLRGLTVDEVQRMMSSIAGHDVPRGVSEAVYRRTEGNPLFVREVLRHLVEQGYLEREDGRPRRETPPDMGLPEGLREVIGKRLSGLSDRCNNVLSVASVIGREFPLQVLQVVAGLTEDDLYAALEEASGVGVLEERSSVGAVVVFRFSHAYFRQTLYEEMFAPRRIRMHQQVGRALEEVYSARQEEHATEMAEHFAHSSDEAGLAKALRYGEMAAGRAMSVNAHAEAARLLYQAIEVQEVLDPDDKAKRCDLLLALGQALMPVGEAHKVYENVAPEAFALTEAIGDDDRAARVCQLAFDAASRYALVVSGGPEARTWAERFDRVAAPGTRHRVYADLANSRVRGFAGDFKLRNGALELARQLGDSDAFLVAARWTISGFAAPQHEEGRLALAREVADKYAPADGEHIGIYSPGYQYYLGVAFLEIGERARAEAIWSRLKERAELTRDANLLGTVLLSDSLIAAQDGRLEEAAAVGERLATLGEELGVPLAAQAQALGWIAWTPMLLLGRTEEVLASVDKKAKELNIDSLVKTRFEGVPAI